MIFQILYFLLSNVFAAFMNCLGLLDNTSTWDNFLQTRNIIWGIQIYLALGIGLVVSSLQFQLICSESERSLHKYEKIFLYILSVSAFGTFTIMALIANRMLFGESVKGLAELIATIVSIIAFAMMFVEYYYISKGSTAKFTKTKKLVINILTFFYVSTGIGACWNTVLFHLFKEVTSPLQILGMIYLCLMILLPFQRHFWFRVMLASKSLKDNVFVTAAILITVILAILPKFLVNLL